MALHSRKHRKPLYFWKLHELHLCNANSCSLSRTHQLIHWNHHTEARMGLVWRPLTMQYWFVIAPSFLPCWRHALFWVCTAEILDLRSMSERLVAWCHTSSKTTLTLGSNLASMGQLKNSCSVSGAGTSMHSSDMEVSKFIIK